MPAPADAGAAHAPPVADWQLSRLGGGSGRLSDFRGRWLVVNFWATWCAPCIEEIPELRRFVAGRGGDAQVVGVNFETLDERRLQAFVDAHAIDYPVFLAEPAEDTPLGPVPALPMTYVLTPRGELAARRLGPVSASMLNDFIDTRAHGRDDGEQ